MVIYLCFFVFLFFFCSILFYLEGGGVDLDCGFISYDIFVWIVFLGV